MSGVEAEVLLAGECDGPTLVLDEPLSFWGGVDPASGQIIDANHPQVGARLGGRVVVMPGSRGSSGTPGALAEALRLGTGPLGVVVTHADANLVTGALVALKLYEVACPVVLVEQAAFGAVAAARRVAIAPDGAITLGS